MKTVFFKILKPSGKIILRKIILETNHQCVLCCQGVCVCLSLSLTVKASSVCNDVWDILEGTDQRPFLVSIILGGSAKFRHLRF